MEQALAAATVSLLVVFLGVVTRCEAYARPRLALGLWGVAENLPVAGYVVTRDPSLTFVLALAGVSIYLGSRGSRLVHAVSVLNVALYLAALAVVHG